MFMSQIGYLLVGNPPFWKTGYANQLDLLGRHLKSQGKTVGYIADFGYAGPVVMHEGSPVYPVSEYPGTLNADSMQIYRRHFMDRYDLSETIMIFLGDIWKWNRIGANFKHTICISPVDGSSLANIEIQNQSTFTHLAAMSKHGQKVMEEYHGGQNILYFPHGYDDDAFPVKKSKRAVRGSWRNPRVTTDSFVVGFLGDFSERKEPAVNLEGFVKFLSTLENPGEVILFVKNKPDHVQAQQVQSLIQQMGIPEQMVRMVEPTKSIIGLSSEEMGELICGLDVLLHCSSQEGFGIIQVEAQAHGVPVINTDFGPMPELNADENLIVPVKSMRENQSIQYGVADSDEIAARLSQLHTEWKNKSSLYDKRIENTKKWANQYSFSNVFNNYIWPTLQKVEETVNTQPVIVHRATKFDHVAIFTTWGVDCGIATYSRMLGEQFLRRGIKVSILGESTEDEPVRDEPYMDGDFAVYRCWNRKYPNADYAANILNKIGAQVLHVQHEWSMFGPALNHDGITRLLAQANSKRVITWHTPVFREVQQNNQETQIADFAMRTTDPLVDLHIVHNSSRANYMLQECMNAIQHIPHGVKELNPKKGRDSIGVPDRVPLLFAYGFINHGKGFHRFMEAALSATKKAPYFEVVVFGGVHPNVNTDKSIISSCTKIAEQSEQIHFIPRIATEEEIDIHACAADFLVYPYMAGAITGTEIYSTTGSLMRAIGAGKPILASDEGRLRDIIGGIHGWKFGQDDVESIEAAIIDAVNKHSSNHPAINEYAENVKSLAKSLSWENVADKHIDCYNSVSGLFSIYPTQPVIIPNKYGTRSGKKHQLLDAQGVSDRMAIEEEE